MAALTTTLVERRRECRQPARDSRWDARAVLRPGVPVTLLNISAHAVLVESESRLRPGAQTEMQLTRNGERTSVRGRLERCYVSEIAPLRYRAVMIFEQSLDVG
jgi:hypothetical protein